MKEQQRGCQNAILKNGKILLYTLWIIFFSITLQGQSMTWVYLPVSASNGACTSSSNCSTNQLCFGLSYTPNVTGTLTSYTTGFFVDCIATGNPVLSNSACLMTDNSNEIDACVSNSLVLLNGSGNSGSTAISTGVPIIIHQVCFSLSENEAIDIVEDEITNLTLSIDLSGGGSVTEFPSYSTFEANHNTVCAPLPIELASFTVVKKEEKVALEWMTLSEKNSDYFLVEWSTDGKNFEAIGQVGAAGISNTKKQYNFEHLSPALGDNYYRLQQVDFGGQYDYSNIRFVSFTLKNTAFSVFPNPTEHTISMYFPKVLAKSNYTIEILSVTGKTLLHIDKKYWNGEDRLTLAVGHLLKGQYFIRLSGKDKVFVKRFIKM